MNEDSISRRALIKTLDVMLVSCENHALREALKEWAKHVPSVSCSEMPNSSGDLISRQAVIDIIDKHFDSIPMEQTTEILSVRREIRNLSYANIPTQMSGTSEDWIRRGDALKAIEEMQMPIMRSMIDRDQFVFKGLGMALEAVKAISSAAVHDSAKDVGWISVKDRLPDIGVEVLTSSDNEWLEIQTLEINSGVKLWENQHGDWQDFEAVKAWRPLPEPWEGEKNG